MKFKFTFLVFTCCAMGASIFGADTSHGRKSPAPSIARSGSPSTADRFREIQRALAAKGYLTTAPNGVWDRNSMAAMQRFQQDQKLEPTGRITARSLQALGLGAAQ